MKRKDRTPGEQEREEKPIPVGENKGRNRDDLAKRGAAHIEKAVSEMKLLMLLWEWRWTS